MDRQSLSDEQMISDATLRSPEVFAQMAQQFYGRVYFTALAIVRQGDIAEDIAQETFLRAWLKRDTVKDPALLLQPWLVRIATNLALQWLRTGQQRSRLLPLIPMEEVTVEPVDDANPDPRQTAHTVEQRKQVAEAVMALPTELRQVVLLHYAEGLSVRDIARMNTEAPSTVTRRLEKARAQLRQHFESGLATGLAMLKPRRRNAEKVFTLITAAAAIPAAARAQLLQLASDTPPPPMIDAVTSAAHAAALQEAGIMKTIIAKIGAAKLIAGAAAIAAVGGGAFAINQLVNPQSKQQDFAKVETRRDNSSHIISDGPTIRSIPGKGTAGPHARAAATRHATDQLTTKKKPSLSDRIALLQNDLVSTQPTYVPGDSKTSAAIYINMQVVDGSGLPVEGATLQLYKFKYNEGPLRGMISIPEDTTGTLAINGYTLEPKVTNAAGIARIMVPKYTAEHLTTSFDIRATHPDYTATFCEMELTSVTKIVMTGGNLLEVIPVDVATSKPIEAGVTVAVESHYHPDWEQRPDGTIAIRKISGDTLLFYLKYTDPADQQHLSAYQRVKFPLESDEPKVIALAQTCQVHGTLSPNVPRPIINGRVRAQASVDLSCTKFGFQEVDVAEDGSFMLTNLPAGEILISGLTEGHNSTRPHDDASTNAFALPQSISVSSSRNYILPMAARGALRIQVVDELQKPVEGAKITLHSQISFNSCSQKWEDNRFAVSDANGYAEITGVPAAQENRLYVTDGWQLVGDPVGETSLVNRLKVIELSSGETRAMTLVVEPSED